METLLQYTNGFRYLWMLAFIMISAGLAKEYNLFAPAYSYVKNTFRSNKFVVVILSAIGGILPIEGRVTVSAGLLDTVAPKDGPGREKLGIVDYLATHHYYLWSPMEKTIVLPIAAFGLTYAGWVMQILPLIVVTFGFITAYIWWQIRDEEVAITPSNFKLSTVLRNVVPMFAAIFAYAYVGGEHIFIVFGSLALYYMFITQQWDLRKLAGYVKWETVIVLAIVVVIGNIFRAHSAEFIDFIKAYAGDPNSEAGIITISVALFCVTMALGSSSKGTALAVILAQAFGPHLFLWLFTVEFCAYLLSPVHKCVLIGNRYFGTPLRTYYTAIGLWCSLMLVTVGVITFVL